MMEGRDALQDFIPDVGQLQLSQIPTEGWIIDPYEHGLLDGPGNAVHFPTHYGKTVHINGMSSGMTMFIYGRGGHKLFLKSVPEDPSQLPNVLLFTTCLGTFKPVVYPTLLGDGVIILWVC